MNKVGLKTIFMRGANLALLRPTLAQTVVISCLLGVVGACFIAGYNAQNIVQKNKLIDNWAIMFLESENMGYRLKSSLDLLARQPAEAPDLRLIFGKPGSMLNAKTASQSFDVSTSQLGFDSEAQLLEVSKKDSSVLFINGASYLVVGHDAGNAGLALKKMPSTIYAAVLGKAEKKARTIYLVSKQGRVIYSSDDKINTENFIGRELVKKFLQSSLSGQIIEFQLPNAKRYYGAVQEITGTNLVLFSEVSRDLLIGSLSQSLQQYALIVVVLVTIIVILISLPITRLSNSLALLERFVRHLGTGDLSPRVQITDCQETLKLGESLNQLAQSISDFTTSFTAEAEDKLSKATGDFKRTMMDDVQSILQKSIATSGKKTFTATMNYIEPDFLSSAICYDLAGSDVSIQSTFISEIRSDASEAMIYQSVVGGIINHAFKNSFEDMKTVIRKIDEVPALIGQTSIESAQYHITKDSRTKELILKIWSKFGLSVFGLQAVLTADRKINLEKSKTLDLGQRTVFESGLPLTPESITILVCRAATSPVVRDLENCPKDYKDDVMAILSGIKLSESLVVNFDDVAKDQRSEASSGQLGVLVIGNFK